MPAGRCRVRVHDALPGLCNPARWPSRQVVARGVRAMGWAVGARTSRITGPAIGRVVSSLGVRRRGTESIAPPIGDRHALRKNVLRENIWLSKHRAGESLSSGGHILGAGSPKAVVGRSDQKVSVLD